MSRTGSLAPAKVAVTRRKLFRWVAASGALLLVACGPVDRPDDARGGRSRERRGTSGLAIVGIIAVDLNQSLRFYRRLGLDVPASVDPGLRSYRLHADDGHVIFWETPDVILGFDRTWSPPPDGDRRIVLEFGFDTPATLDATYHDLVDHGVVGRLAPFELGAGVRYAIVLDPDGNQVSLRFPATG